MRKMKDLRGSSVAAVRNAIFRVYALQTSTKGRRNSSEFMEWKNSKDVGNTHKHIFSDKIALETLTTSAFPSSLNISDEIFSDYYIYTASVCDIILNPRYQSPDVSKKPLELRLRKFKVSIDIFFLLFKKIY